MKRNIVFKHLGNTYPITMPTMGQLLEIEDRKARFANNNYSGIVQNKTDVSERMLDMVDMSAHFYTLVPNLIKDLPIESKNLFDLDIMDSKKLHKAYKDQLLPWLKEIERTLLKPEKKEDEK